MLLKMMIGKMMEARIMNQMMTKKWLKKNKKQLLNKQKLKKVLHLVKKNKRLFHS
jgi:hypothetical protein